MALAVPAYSWLRVKSPTAAWDRSGNVWTGPFNGIDVLVVVLLTLAARAMALTVASRPEASSQTYAASSVLSSSAMFVVVGAGLCLVLAVRRVNLVELFGLDRLSPKRLLVWSFGGAIAAIVLTQIFATLWTNHVIAKSWTEVSEQTLVTLLRESPDLALRLAIVISACVLQPVTEELIFRGYIYPALKKQTDRPMAMLLSAMVFAALHLHVPVLGPLLFLGILLAVAYELSGSLWVPIAIHALFNTTTVVFQIVRP